MGLLTGHSSANLIEYEPEATRVFHAGYFAPAGVWYEVLNTVTTARYAYVGMTKAAAETCVAAIDDPDTGVSARAVLAGGGGMYSVEVDKYFVQVSMEAVTP